MSTATQFFRTACEECHTRKVRCKPSSEESSRGGTTRCEACRINGRKCLFSLRAKTGRPRNQTVPGYTSTNLPLPSPPPTASTAVAFSSSSSLSGASNNTLDSPKPNPNEYAYHELPPWSSSIHNHRDQTPLDFSTRIDQAGQVPSEGHDLSTGGCIGCSDGPWRLPGFSPLLQDVFSATSSSIPASSPFGDMLSSMYPESRPQSTMPYGDQSNAESIPRSSISPGSPSHHLPQYADYFSRDTNEYSKSDTPFQSQMRKPETVSDIVKTIELCDQVRKYGHAIPRKRISLLSSKDAAEVHEMLTSVDKLCSKIHSIIPQQPHSGQLRDQPTFIMVFSAVMQTIEQTVDRLGSVAEFEQASQTEGLSMLSNSMIMAVPHLQIEHLLSLTRLDFYLLQMKSFITLFDTSLELLAAAESIFRPAESSARLVSYHRCLEIILGRWKNEWCK